MQLEYEIAKAIVALTEFQSHIGAIRMEAVGGRLNLLTDFNPTLVQLEWKTATNPESTKKISIPHWCN